MGFFRHRSAHRIAKAHTGPLAALDIGTTKVCCFIAHGGEGGPLRIKGIGHHRSEGIRNVHPCGC